MFHGPRALVNMNDGVSLLPLLLLPDSTAHKTSPSTAVATVPVTNILTILSLILFIYLFSVFAVWWRHTDRAQSLLCLAARDIRPRTVQVRATIPTHLLPPCNIDRPIFPVEALRLPRCLVLPPFHINTCQPLSETAHTQHTACVAGVAPGTGYRF